MSAYCPTCGLVGYRWAGCTDDFHYSPACDPEGMRDNPVERVYGGNTKGPHRGLLASSPQQGPTEEIGAPHE